MDRLPVIYIAGPYRAKTPWQILHNIRMAQTVALEIWKLGAVALCPHANTALFDGEADDSVWLLGDLELIRRCDAVVMLNTWHTSTGARAEKEFAHGLKLTVFGSHPGDWPLIKEWIDGWKKSRRTEAERRPPPNLADFWP